MVFRDRPRSRPNERGDEPQWPQSGPGQTLEPRADVFEESDRIVVRVELAGVRGEDISLSYHRDSHTLLIRGERHHDEVVDGPVSAHQLEIYYGEYTRAIRLPDVEIDAESVRGSYRNGFLLVHIPKN